MQKDFGQARYPARRTAKAYFRAPLESERQRRYVKRAYSSGHAGLLRQGVEAIRNVQLRRRHRRLVQRF